MHVRRPAEAAFTFELPFPPLLESWERRDHPAQLRLDAYRTALRELAEPALEVLRPPLALALHVAGRADIASGCDLDNFLTPLVKALGGGGVFSFVSATRGRPDERARMTLAEAGEMSVDVVGEVSSVATRIGVSATSTSWKEHIATAVGTDDVASLTTPVQLALRFAVSPQRNWVTVWKPSIDALGAILGESDRPWHPRDDRISLLVLECSGPTSGGM